jgi:aryl-alcohol dehydrogenase-like predicted oxidoreductase
MQTRQLGGLWPVSELTLGGGGLGMLWGETTREECVATVQDAVAAGITLLDMAPRYGDGLAESIVGEALDGRMPPGVRITTKCLRVRPEGGPDPVGIADEIRASLEASLKRLRLDRVDLYILHAYVCDDDNPVATDPEYAWRFIPYSWFRDAVRPTFEALKAEGIIGDWGMTGTGSPPTIMRLLADEPKPAVVQCMANLLDSAGSLKFYPEPEQHRETIAAAVRAGVGVMGIRAVQAGALTAAIDRPLPADHAEVRDFNRAAGFRALCAELGANPAVIAHRYTLSMPGVDTVVLGVKNRRELAECVAGINEGPLAPDLMSRIDASVAQAA